MAWMKYVRYQWDRVGAWVAILAGAIALVIGWLGVSDTGFVFEQLPYVVSGGIGGLFLLGIGAMLWLSADLRDEWRKLDGIEQALLAQRERHHEPAEDAVTAHTDGQTPVKARRKLPTK